MKKLVLALVLLGILFLLNAKPVLAETNNVSDTKIRIIQNCEKIFPDLEKIGVEKFRERYQYFQNFRSCTVLFNNSIWYTNNTDRLEKLSLLLDQPSSKALLQNQSVRSQLIPEWIKTDAKKWQQGLEDASILSQGIRYLINSNMETPVDINSNFCQTGMCVKQNDFVSYSIKNTDNQNIITIAHTFHNIDANSFAVTTVQISNNVKKTNSAQLNKQILVNSNDLQCCDYHDFIQNSLSSGLRTSSNSIVQINSEVVYPFKDQKRAALVAKDLTGSYYEIVDKQTGIIIFAKHQDRIQKIVWTAELLDTNMFSNNVKLQDGDIKIPQWFKGVVQWWVEGKITDTDYLSGIVYLTKLNVLRV